MSELSTALGDYIDLYSVERAKMNKQLERDITAAISQHAANGILISSAAMIQLVRMAQQSLAVRAQSGLTIMLRCLSAHGVVVDRDNVAICTAKMAELIGQELGYLTGVVNETPVGKSPHFRSAGASPLRELDTSAELEIRRLSGETRLVVAANASRSANVAATSSVVVNGPVGVLQTGAGSFGTAYQTISEASADELAKALQSVASAVAQLSDADLPPGQKAELVELAQDAAAEVGKPTRNVQKVKSLVSGVGSAISWLPKIRPAYDTLKWAAAFIGVALP